MKNDLLLLNSLVKKIIVLTRKTSSGYTSINHYILDITGAPNSKSYAAAVLLKNDLMIQDVDYIEKEDNLNIWLEFREVYLNKILQKDGDLVCVYCGKPHLEVGGRTPKDLILNNKNPNLATIDHIHALSDGGAKYDEKNMCVACKKCNRKKGNKPVEEFKNNLNNL
jgi:5-methylcytosine-specific restriction endonuclease McrA